MSTLKAPSYSRYGGPKFRRGVRSESLLCFLGASAIEPVAHGRL